MSTRKNKSNKRSKQKAEQARQERLRSKGVEFEITPEGKAMPTSIPMSPELVEQFRAMEQRYIEKTGHSIPAHMTMGEVLDEVGGKELGETYLPSLLQGLWTARVDPAKIYAIFKTDGLIPTEQTLTSSTRISSNSSRRLWNSLMRL